MRVIVVGGGIGGLATALSLHAAGIDVEVYESAPQIRPLGVGLNLLPHAVRELVELDLLDLLCEAGVATADLTYFSKHGRRIWTEPRGLDAGYAWPQFSMHRGRLQGLLLQAVQERMGPDKVRLGMHCLGVECDCAPVRAAFAATPGGPVIHRAEGDILVGADGVHSTIRRTLYPDEGLPRWSGAMLWRAIGHASPFLSGRSLAMAGAGAQKFICYPISNTLGVDGRQEMNWIAEVQVAEPGSALPAREDWSKMGSLESVLPRFGGWVFDWMDIPALIRSAPTIWEFPMVDRDPLPEWNRGRVTLLGDAAHPMYPIGGNGASQAIIDARVLAWYLATSDDIDTALAAYDGERRPKTAAIIKANRAQGPDQVMQIVEERAPGGFDDLDSVISQDELSLIAARYRRLAGYDPVALNGRGSYSVQAA